MKTASGLREDLLQFVHDDLVGPAHGDCEILDDPPQIRYAAGVLFPQETRIDESGATGGIEEVAASALEDEQSTDFDAIANPDLPSEDDSRVADDQDAPVDDQHDDTITMANSYKPSAMGISFMVATTAGEIVVRSRAAIYSTLSTSSPAKKSFDRNWVRKPLDLPAVTIKTDISEPQTIDRELLYGLHLRTVVRPKARERALVTVSIYNGTQRHQQGAASFYQVGLEVLGTDGTAPFVEYRGPSDSSLDSEDETLGFLYRSRRVFAVGHGCAAGWRTSQSDRADAVFTEVLPSVTVAPVVPRSDEKSYLDMQFLAGLRDNTDGEIIGCLNAFCDDYLEWIRARTDEIESLEPELVPVANRHMLGCQQALERMRRGVKFLASDVRALEAFRLSNRAMLMQQYHSKLRRRLADDWVELPTKWGYESEWSRRRGYWRSFQLAFLLMTLPGIAAEADAMREDEDLAQDANLVDLIWFPTGGGKTEAYLGISAFLIFLSRLRQGDRAGCQILMRYTLRLLTSQQFQRAASLICACEILRRETPRSLGKTPVTIGLWVGMTLTPNEEKLALRKMTDLHRRKANTKNPFQLLSCPWCGTELDNPDHLGYVEYQHRQIFLCPASGNDSTDRCPFSIRGEHLPVTVVDQSVYNDPPTLLIGTVDKFAMLAWRKSAGRIFQVGGGPELVIQDELHLITGPLGSMVGVYEGVIDYLASRSGRPPKIIASTATIRRAPEQCRALYDRAVFQFPPPGLDASDSYFAIEDKNSPGRIYVGFLPTASSSPLTAQIRSVVALQQGAKLIAGHEPLENALDPYWTLIQYFGSLKELGRAATFLTADIPEFMPTMHRRYNIEGEDRRWMRTSEELTSRRNEDEIPKIIKKLEMPYRNGAKWDDQALDTVLATNMISVGVDIDRLGLMMVVTQPKGTSEYIQASSRVGRSTNSPGLILTLYNASRPRDRSHYEQFRAYHEAFYRYVEPTSVTPYAPPAMNRALHAVLVIAGRHIAGWERPSDLDEEHAGFSRFLEFLRARVERVDPVHVQEFDALVRQRLDEWGSGRPEKWGDFGGMRDEPTLMRPAGTPPRNEDESIWETPTSMRNVDVECSAEVIARYLLPNGDR